MNRSIRIAMRLAAAGAVTLGLITPAPAASYKVTIATMDCNGDTGLASVDLENFYKIETTDCGPERPDVKLKQVLLRSGTTGFDVFTVTPQAAQQLQKDIQLYMDARRRSVERGGTVILEK